MHPWRNAVQDLLILNKCAILPCLIIIGIVFGDYGPQWKLQRHTSMTVLRSLGYGKNIIQQKISHEAKELCQSLESKLECNVDISDEIR